MERAHTYLDGSRGTSKPLAEMPPDSGSGAMRGSWVPACGFKCLLAFASPNTREYNSNVSWNLPGAFSHRLVGSAARVGGK
jgi:hypothetical protein